MISSVLILSALAGAVVWIIFYLIEGDEAKLYPNGYETELGPSNHTRTGIERAPMYLDHWGLIVQKDFDGGDTLHRHGSLALVQAIAARKGLAVPDKPGRPHPRPWRDAQKVFEVRPGIYRRHPDPHKWYSNPDTTSRDQLVPTLIALGLWGMRRELFRLQSKIVLRGLFAQNIYRNWEPVENQKKKIPDTFIAALGILIRGWGLWALPLYPVLVVLDAIDFLGQAIELIPIHVTDEWKVRRKDPSDADDMNTVNKHLQALIVLPTPFSWAARKIYSKFRMKTLGTLEMGEPNRVMGALVYYNRAGDANGNPEIAEAYRPLVEKYFS